jgi:rhamnose utilization protein RhaD (predicted bifunctional aldolase and dehydrogenase)
MSNSTDMLDRLVELSRGLGSPTADCAILAEGNTSARIDDDRFLLKASGFSLGEATRDSFVEMDTNAVLGMLGNPPRDDAELTAALEASRAADGPRPSVEAALHALALTTGGASYVGHSHPTAVNSILCSAQPDALAKGALFPDQIVVCGPQPLFVPYVDPGVPLALEFRDRLAAHVARFGEGPKVAYLQNHGMIAFGATAREVMQITWMAVKAARIMLGSFALGGPRYLSETAAVRIETRPDEHYRQSLLRAGER